jgi:hypothetical protein
MVDGSDFIRRQRLGGYRPGRLPGLIPLFHHYPKRTLSNPNKRDIGRLLFRPAPVDSEAADIAIQRP